MIEIKNLTKKFGQLTVLDGISETINKGEKIVIIGPSGGGKSTFLRCLNLLETPTSGSIVFDTSGEERKSLSVADLLARFKDKVGKELTTDRILLS